MKLQTLNREACEKMAKKGEAHFIPPHTFEFEAWKSKIRITFRPDLPGLEVK